MFSESEESILKIIGRRKMTIAEITEEYFAYVEPRLDDNNYVGSVIRRIKKKCDFHKLPWTLVGKGGGRGGRTVWRSKR